MKWPLRTPIPSAPCPSGARTIFRKFKSLTDGILDSSESDRFLETVQRLPDLGAADLAGLNVQLPAERLERSSGDDRGFF